MGYKNAMCVLPNDLLAAVQQHIDGEYIYIPRKAENKKPWGERKNSGYQLDQRNRAIFEHYQGGISVGAIAGQYYLSPKTIYKILSAVKNGS